MPTKFTSGPPGRVVVLEHRSKVLQGNPLGDPSVRPLHVWLPPQYDDPEFAEQRFPALFDLVGFLGSGAAHTNWKSFGENVPERAARERRAFARVHGLKRKMRVRQEVSHGAYR